MATLHKICQITSNTKNNLFKIYTDLLREGRENIKNILPILNIMLFISASTAPVEHGFLKLSIKKTSLHTRLKKNKTLSNCDKVWCENNS